MGELAILIGLQASGKTTFRTRMLAGHTVVSKDDFPRARRRQRRQELLVDRALAAGRDVVVDNTNPSPDEWRPLVEIGRRHGATVAGFWFAPDRDGCVARNAARAARERVPDVGLFATLARLRRPGAGDGFDRLFEVRFDGAGGFAVTPMPVPMAMPVPAVMPSPGAVSVPGAVPGPGAASTRDGG